MRIPMIVTKAFRPGGSNSPELQPGSPFEASGESQARVFRALGWVKDAPQATPAVQPPPAPAEPGRWAYRRKVVGVVDAPDGTASSEAPAKRKYQRRDMTARDDKPQD